MVTFAALLMLVIALGYMSFAFAVVGILGRKLYRWAKVNEMNTRIRAFIIVSIVGTVIFLIGCAGTHFEIMAHLNSDPEFAEEMSVHMIVTGIPQAVGVWGPTWLLVLVSRELEKASKTVENKHNGDGE